MRIRRIEILGFKSFVDRTVLEFPPGVTAVVGPNGCGKSNVVDAIRWVMGEQSAKNLRGRQMEDVIFAGSEGRRSLGMAEVSLVFSTDDGRVPAKYLNYSEIQVTRKLYRDGESEYSLNKTPCRLLDINELFMDTGVGARAYSIIEQGRIGMILMAKPEERRFLIEEAAGVTKFKSRKQVALRKIDATRQNLLRIGDIVAEIRRQLASLQRQAKKAERFKLLREELKGIDLAVAARQYRQLSESISRLAGEQGISSDRLAAMSAHVAAAEADLEEVRVAVIESEREIAGSQEEIFKAKGEYEACLNRVDFQRRELASLDRQCIINSDDLSSLAGQLAGAEAELRLLEDQRGAFLTESGGEEDNLAQQNAALEAHLAEESRLVRQQEEVRQSLIALLNRLAQLNNQHGEAGRRLDRLAERIERSRREGELLTEQLTAALLRVAELDGLFAAANAARKLLTENVEKVASLCIDLRTSLASREAELQSHRDELSASGARLASLRELEAQFAGYGQGVKSLFLAESFRGRFAGVVADLVEAGAEHEAALEAVLGDRLQYVVSSDDGQALEAIAHLKAVSGGRCSFLLAGWGQSQAQSSPDVPRLLDLVRVNELHRSAVEPLLADVHLVADMDSALSHARKYPSRTFVTSAGDVASQGGILTGGSQEGVGQGLIHTKREIRELAGEVERLEALVGNMEGQRDRLREELQSADGQLDGLRQEAQQSDLHLVHLEKDLQRARDDLRLLEERRTVKLQEDGQLAEERLSLEQERSGAEAARAELETAKAGYEASLASIQESLSASRKLIEGLREGVTALKVRVATLQEKRESNQSAIARVEGLLVDYTRRIAARQAELANAGEEKKRLHDEIILGDESLKVFMQRQVSAEARYAGVREKFETLTARLQEQEAGIKSHRELLASERDAAGERQLRLAELSMQLRHLEESVQDRHRIDITQFTPDEALSSVEETDLHERQIGLQRQIDEVGEVNLMAIDEYRELEERHSFLAEQKGDLEESLKSLQTAIQRINRTTRKRFLETFIMVNDKFREVFPRLFCGGRAELRLTNEDDLLETGIEIIVQPPGKKLQNVLLLSGGEKALTAVALIFSIFLVKPSPFCLLDEVDAPLDDANIGRFNEMIREMTSFSQFILITHSKTTMAVADTLYGVTMEEPGVSKVVSVRLQ